MPVPDEQIVFRFKTPFDVVDIEHPERLDWRRCSLSVISTTSLLLPSTPKAYLRAIVRNKATGRPTHNLMEGAFVAAIGAVFARVLVAIPTLATENAIPSAFLYHGGSRAFVATGKSSATLTFGLLGHISEALLQASAHDGVRLHAKAREIALHQARQRQALAG